MLGRVILETVILTFVILCVPLISLCGRRLGWFDISNFWIRTLTFALLFWLYFQQLEKIVRGIADP